MTTIITNQDKPTNFSFIFLLQESGDFLLLETGDKIILATPIMINQPRP